MTIHPRWLGLLLCAAGLPVPAADAINTDRPDFVESSDVVDAGRLQIETGVSVERDRSGTLSSRIRSTPTLLRFGLGHELEARIEGDGLLRSRSSDSATGVTSTASGAADVSLGIKWRSAGGDAKTGAPATAWLLHVDVDSGSAAFRGSGLRPSLRFVAEWDLADDWSIGVMPGLMRDTDDNGKHFVAGLFAVTVSTEIAPRWHAFAELAAPRIAPSSRGGTMASFDTGVTYAIGNDMQVDLALLRGLTRQTPDLTVGVGFSIRF